MMLIYFSSRDILLALGFTNAVLGLIMFSRGAELSNYGLIVGGIMIMAVMFIVMMAVVMSALEY